MDEIKLIGPGSKGDIWGGFHFGESSDLDPESQRTWAIDPGLIEDEGNFAGPGDIVRIEAPTVRSLKPHAGPAVAVYDATVPEPYQLLGCYVLASTRLGRATDFGISYGLPGSEAIIDRPDLWITWSDRAPRPFSVPIERIELDRRLGLPTVRLEMSHGDAIFQEWWNEEEVPQPARISSSLNWWDGNRLWAVQGEEDVETLVAVASSLAVVE